MNLLSVPLSVTVVGKDEIEERFPGGNTAEKLIEVPGVSYSHTRSAAGNTLSVSIRGQRPWRILYLIDGIRQSSIFKEDMNKSYLNIDPDDIERIEVIKGPASALYGSDALGGVVNVITKNGGMGNPVGGRVKLTYDGSRNGFQPSVAVYGDTEKLSYRISGSYNKAGNRRTVEAGKLEHSSFKSQNVLAQIGYYLTPDLNLNIKYTHYDADIDESPFKFYLSDRRYFYYPVSNPLITELSKFPKNRRDTVIGTLTAENLSQYLERMTLNIHYQARDFLQRGIHNNNANAGKMSVDLRDVTDSLGADIQFDFSLGAHLLNLGFEYEKDSLENESQVGFDAQNFIYEANHTQIALFAQDTWNIYGPLSLNGGLRQTWITTELTRIDMDPKRVQKLNYDNLVGNIGLTYEATDNLMFRLRYSQGFRSPDLAAKVTGTIYMEANSDVQPEKSENYEFGARYMDGSLYFDVAVFYDRVTDYMASRYLYTRPSGSWVSDFVNVAKYDAKGLEVELAYAIGETGFTPHLNFSLLDSALSYPTYETKNTGAPKKWGSVGLKWEKHFRDGESRFFVDGTYRFSDGFGIEFQRNPHNPNAATTPWLATESGKTADINMGLDWGFGGAKKLKAVLALKNVFNKEYQPAYFYYPSRHVVLSVSYEF
jgi:hemoglobin/transferrin/lactoferrin receptor protein